MPKKKTTANPVSGGLSFVKEALLSGHHKINKGIDAQFPKLAFTLDTQTVRILEVLQRPTQNSRPAISRQIISEMMASPELFPAESFYRDIWRTQHFRFEPAKQVVQLVLPPPMNRYLRERSAQLLGVENRSEMFRMLVALYAMKKGLLKRVQIEAFALQLEDPGDTSTVSD